LKKNLATGEFRGKQVFQQLDKNLLRQLRRTRQLDPSGQLGGMRRSADTLVKDERFAEAKPEAKASESEQK
jgi:hypothetical protein